eukprot:TRINITY_DN7515_c0_g1_i1.p1 TRINITY_DN7515_c0_g1~~TRINITY_DN7515_c0_g1_i1.p1  ORF type:complete len:624 (-),score=94.09 TRINITY_DN7515_c0_g1_i1:21-1892(-)
MSCAPQNVLTKTPQTSSPRPLQFNQSQRPLLLQKAKHASFQPSQKVASPHKIVIQQGSNALLQAKGQASSLKRGDLNKNKKPSSFKTHRPRANYIGMEWVISDSESFLSDFSSETQTEAPVSPVDDGFNSPIEDLFEDLDSFSSIDSLEFFQKNNAKESKKRERHDEQIDRKIKHSKTESNSEPPILYSDDSDNSELDLDECRKVNEESDEDDESYDGNQQFGIVDYSDSEETDHEDFGNDTADEEDSSSDDEDIITTLISARRKLAHIDNSLEAAVKLIQEAKNIVILTGAGVSVSSGIPDFRSKGGVYDIIESRYNLPRPEALFDLHYLFMNPRPFFEFAKELLPGRYPPSPTHRFLKLLEDKGKLLRLYTQNIDTLDYIVGISPEKIVACHGSMADASCIRCKTKYACSDIRHAIEEQKLPLCTACNPDPNNVDNTAFIKPNIVFFGESLPDRFDECLFSDMHHCDLLIVMGSSLAVRPVCLIPTIMPSQIPQILVNRQVVGLPNEFDIVSLGDCDDIIHQYCEKLGWKLPDATPTSSFLTTLESSTPKQIIASSNFDFNLVFGSSPSEDDGSDSFDKTATKGDVGDDIKASVASNCNPAKGDNNSHLDVEESDNSDLSI